ncbi:aminopeptidase N [Arthrobacter castelli]|uniref:aminopeptidase N n=1 Tax=Arthrobacter castelli TaxID=271431 RepID=UPI00040F38C8|nr:aminopeptidase N [Arthrobacter castelli]
MAAVHNLSRNEAARRSQLISVQSYDISLDLRTAPDPDAAGFTTQSIITFTCGEPGAGTFLDFIGAGVHSVMLNGRAQDLDEVVSDGRIALENLAAENQVTVTATGLYSRSGEGMHRFVDPADGRTYLYTQYEPADARRVFANFEQPDLKGRYSFHVIAPDDWTTASNGALAQRTKLTSVNGLSRWDFAETEPISTYITTVLAGPYFSADDAWSRELPDGTTLDIPLTVFSRSSLADSFDTDNIFDLTKRGLDFFHDLFGVPYPFGKYDQAFVPEYNLGAMENPGLVTFTEAYIFRSRATDAQYQGRATTIMHEMAHMWFGDLVTMFWWDDLWLKESFADYMGTLAVAEATEWDSAWVSFANGRKAWAYLQDQLPTTHPIVADITDLEAAKQNFDGITYAKGASVLKQLVAYVGFESFIAGSRQYFADHAFGNTSLNDLLDALSASSGRDLTEWSRQWLQTSGISTLEAKVKEHDGVVQEVTVAQDAVDPVSGQQQPRPHRLKLGCYNFDGDRLIRTDSAEADISGATTPVSELTGTRRPALLLVNDEDLTYAKVRFDDVSLATISGHLSDIDDVLARALCWSGLWNMARDSVLPAQDYVSAVERHAPAETDVGVTQNLLLNARTAIERYTSVEARDEVRDRHMAAVVEQMQLAPAGSDQQLAWARAAAALGRSTDSHSEYFAQLLSADATIDGLVLDPELRWKFLQALTANGRTTEALLLEELEADNTASGRAGFTSAMAARPFESVKREAWNQAVHGNELSNELLSATIDGFNQGPRHLLDPYTASYFDVIEDVWQTKSIELASRIVRGLFPSGQDQGSTPPASHPVAVKAEAWLRDHGDAPAALRRIVIEQRDHLLRALAAQAKSAATTPAATASRS